MWHKGTSRNLQQGIIIEMFFKMSKVTNEAETDFAINDVNNNIQNSKSSFYVSRDHKDLMSFAEKSALKPLFYLKSINHLYYKTVHADVRNEFFQVYCQIILSFQGICHVKNVLRVIKSLYLLQSRK